jgi:predicted NBD/HSP70 family sugar kinase
MAEITVGIDIGGTKIQAAAISHGAVAGSGRVMTPDGGPKALADAAAEAVDAALAEASVSRSDVRAAGTGIPGSVDADAGTVANSPNLIGFEGAEPIPFAALLSDALGGADVRIENDVRVAILGEWKRGAGEPYENLLGVWVGTGVGGGLVLRNALYEGTGPAGEIGHMIVKPGGRECSDGRKGHLEAYAGRGRMEAYAREQAKKGRKTILFDLMVRKGRTRLSSGVIASALEKGDKLANELVDEAVWALAIALASVQNLLALEAIVIGGGLGDRLGEPFVRRIDDEMKPLLFVPDAAPKLLGSRFGDLSGAVGAAVMVGG